MQYSINQTG